MGLRVPLTHESTHVPNEAEEAALGGICAAFAVEEGECEATALAGPLVPCFLVCLLLSRQSTEW